ncbi:hypothetical protein O9929_10760 [Vibrio lentus]|nr:hypothetical protein [Vibrio lentus]
MLKLWEDFAAGSGSEVNVRDFIQKNYTPYEGDESFLVSSWVLKRLIRFWASAMEGIKQENATKAPVDFDTSVISTITSHDAGYIQKTLKQLLVYKLKTTKTCNHP